MELNHHLRVTKSLHYRCAKAAYIILTFSSVGSSNSGNISAISFASVAESANVTNRPVGICVIDQNFPLEAGITCGCIP